MNEPSPLVPQGSFEAQARRKSHVKIAVFSILAVHVVVLGGLLILGCKREEKPEVADNAGTPPALEQDLTPPPFGAEAVTTSTPPVTPVEPLAGSPQTGNPAGNPAPVTPNTSLQPPPVAPVTPVQPPVQPATETAAVIEHKITRGESFSTLATKYGVTVKAIQDANPNLVPTRLQIGNVVKIPPKSATVSAVPGNGATVPEAAGTYTVKSGDTLGAIAKNHQTTVKELQALNNLKTTQIKVGDKLKLPQRSAAGSVPPAQ